MKFFWIAGWSFIFLLLLHFSLAIPAGPSTLSMVSSSRYPLASASNTSAMAGNVSELTILADSITQTWQGYFGNVSGAIVLGDSNNNTLYNWTLASANGEIYAVRDSVTPTWSSVRCANFTELLSEESVLNVPVAAADGLNETFFNTSVFNDFYVGPLNINSTQDCYATNLYNDTGAQSAYFSEVILSDTTANLIYTSILNDNIVGFDSLSHDFEMIVGEDGHNGDTNPTPYYFYVELQ